MDLAPADAVKPFFDALERNLNDVAEQKGELAVSVPVAYFEAVP